eukprot:631570-Pyramimonas_sp.AAC.1
MSSWTDAWMERYERARHGHCRIDHKVLIKPPYHPRIQFSRRFLTDMAHIRVEPYGERHGRFPVPVPAPSMDVSAC